MTKKTTKQHIFDVSLMQFHIQFELERNAEVTTETQL